MGNRVVVLPKTVDQIVRELGNGRDRFCGTADQQCRVRGIRGGETCQREVIAFVAGRAEIVGTIGVNFLHRAVHVTTNLRVSNAANHRPEISTPLLCTLFKHLRFTTSYGQASI